MTAPSFLTRIALHQWNSDDAPILLGEITSATHPDEVQSLAGRWYDIQITANQDFDLPNPTLTVSRGLRGNPPVPLSGMSNIS